MVASIAVAAISLSSVADAQKVKKKPEPKPLGWVENALVTNTGLPIVAKLDSGALTTSINADILKIVKAKKDESGKKRRSRVVFSLTNAEGQTVTLEKTIVRWVRIKNRPKDLRRRPVVIMKLCLAGRLVEGEVNLSDRDGLNYPLLVGRNMLRPTRILIDSRKKFTHEPDCPDQASQK